METESLPTYADNLEAFIERLRQEMEKTVNGLDDLGAMRPEYARGQAKVARSVIDMIDAFYAMPEV